MTTNVGGRGAVLEVVDTYRRRLVAKDTKAGLVLLRDWRRLRDTVEAEADALARRMARKLEAGEAIPASWLHQEGHLDAILRQITAETERFSRTAAPALMGNVDDAADLADNMADRLLPEHVGTTLPTAATEVTFATTAHRETVGRVLQSMAPQMADLLRLELTRGIALGENPLQVAARMRRLAGVPLQRARTVARTESMRAFRGASQARFAASPVVTGWVWVAGLDGRTCGACYALHGTVHPDTDTMESHPNCRCAMAPLTEGADVHQILGGPTGAEAIGRMSPAELRSRFGPAKAKLLSDGTIQPADLVGVRTSPLWGRTRTEASVRQAVENARARGAGGLPPTPAPTPAPRPRPVPAPPARLDLDRMTNVRADPADLFPVRTLSDALYMDYRVAEGDKATMVMATQDVERALPGLRVGSEAHGDRPIHVETRDARGMSGPNVHAQVETGGWGTPNGISRTVQALAMREGTDAFTLAHELGHVVDALHGQVGLDEVSTSFRSDPLVAKWLAAVKGSQSYQRLVRARGISAEQDEYLDYLQDPHELWARSFSQYVAIRAGDGPVREAYRQRVDLRRHGAKAKAFAEIHWRADDFKPIREALDALFQAKGWR